MPRCSNSRNRLILLTVFQTTRNQPPQSQHKPAARATPVNRLLFNQARLILQRRLRVRLRLRRLNRHRRQAETKTTSRPTATHPQRHTPTQHNSHRPTRRKTRMRTHLQTFTLKPLIAHSTKVSRTPRHNRDNQRRRRRTARPVHMVSKHLLHSNNINLPPQAVALHRATARRSKRRRLARLTRTLQRQQTRRPCQQRAHRL